MEKKNKYANRSKIPEVKFRQMVRLFAEDYTAGEIAEMTDINRNTVNRYLMAIRQRIADCCENSTAFEDDNAAQEYSFEFLRRLLESGGLASQGISNYQVKALQKTVHVQVESGTFIRLKSGSGHEGFICIGKDDLYKAQTGENAPVRAESQCNEIEEFWEFAKARLAQFYGLPKSTFCLHLKECEFRFNHKNEDLYLLILRLLRNKPLF